MDALPQGGDAFHGKYARNEIYTLVEDFAAEPPGRENSTITPIPGDVCAFWFTGQELGSASHGYSDERRPAEEASIVDLALFYERNNLLLNPSAGSPAMSSRRSSRASTRSPPHRPTSGSTAPQASA
jgi:Protein of unknown function (DUF3830)